MLNAKIDYWAEGRHRSAVMTYVCLYAISLVCATLLTIRTGTVIPLYFVLGVVPAIVLIIPRSRFNPMDGIEAFIQTADPGLHESIAQQIPFTDGVRRKARFLAILIKNPQTNNARVRSFVQNYASVNRLAMYGAFIWFLNGCGLVVISFLGRR